MGPTIICVGVGWKVAWPINQFLFQIQVPSPFPICHIAHSCMIFLPSKRLVQAQEWRAPGEAWNKSQCGEKRALSTRAHKLSGLQYCCQHYLAKSERLRVSMSVNPIPPCFRRAKGLPTLPTYFTSKFTISLLKSAKGTINHSENTLRKLTTRHG